LDGGAGVGDYFHHHLLQQHCLQLRTHPNPERRIEQIQAAIQEEFPRGVPEGLIQ
jgi:hypothetical protein